MISRGIGLVLLGVILLSSLAAAESGLDKLNEQIVSGADTIEKTREQIEEAKWEYLSEKWKETLLKNKYVFAVDGFLKKINIVFVLILGINYDLSFTFFMVLFLWIIFLLYFSYIFRTFMPLSSPIVPSLVSVGMVIIVAQLGTFNLLSDYAFKLIFYKSGIWPLISTLFLIVLIIVLFGLLRAVFMITKGMKKQEKERQESADRSILHNWVEKIAKAGGKSK